jgi:CRP-like cAMP-binding protein
MNGTSVKQSLLSELQGHLSADLFADATQVRRAADEVLFVAGDAGNGCYRVEDGLVKVTMMSRAGVRRLTRTMLSVPIPRRSLFMSFVLAG